MNRKLLKQLKYRTERFQKDQERANYNKHREKKSPKVQNSTALNPGGVQDLL